MAGILTASLAACSQEQPEPKDSPAAESKTGSLSFLTLSNNSAGPGQSKPLASNDPARDAEAAAPPADNSESITIAANLSANPEWATMSEKQRKHAEREQKEALKDAEKAKKRLAKRGNIPAPAPLSEAERRDLAQKRTEADQKAADEARKNINSTDDSVRMEAVRDLDPDNADDLKLLLKTLNSDPDPSIREEIAGMLGFGEYRAAVPSLLKSLNDPEPEVVVSAIESLSWYEGSEKDAIIEAINQLHSDGLDARVKEAAQTALSSLKTEL